MIGELEDLRQIGFRARDAARVAAAQHALDARRESRVLLLDEHAAADDVDRRVRIDKAEHIEADLHVGVDLDDVLAPQLPAGRVFDDSHRAVERVQPQQAVQLHRAAGADMVNDDTVDD